jgi:hypothetical protein
LAEVSTSTPFSSSPSYDTHILTHARIDCTPKAVSHRLANIRKGGSTRPTGAVSTTPRTPGSRVKTTPRRKKNDVVSDEEGPEGLDVQLDSPTAARGKRVLNANKKTSYAEDPTDDEEDIESDGPSKKRAKKEPVEEDVVQEEEFNDEI